MGGDKDFEELCEEVDVAVFSGDTLLSESSLSSFKEYLRRWSDAVDLEYESIDDGDDTDDDENL